MKRILLTLLLASCGGGSGGNAPPQELVQRTDGLYFTYYGGEQGQVAAVAEHTNLMHSIPWDGPDVQIAEMQQAKARGIGIMLDLPEAWSTGTSEIAVRARFQQLQALDLISSVKAIYPVDEPDLAGLGTNQIGTTNAMIRRVMAEFGMNVPIAVIYSASFTWPGIQHYDWVGFDNYDANIFGNGDYNRLKAVVRKDQRILLVPGGADKWRQDPAPFLAQAQKDGQVIAILAFIWRDNSDPARGASLGIKSNGMKRAYCAAGRTAINRPGIC